jgi:5-formyltetrahydrofolate cyclo-ligase
MEYPEPVGWRSLQKKNRCCFRAVIGFDPTPHCVYGKGFAIFLACVKPDVIKVGVSFFEAEEMIPI